MLSTSLTPEGMTWTATATAVFFPLQHCIPYDGDGDAAAVFWFAFPPAAEDLFGKTRKHSWTNIYRHALLFHLSTNWAILQSMHEINSGPPNQRRTISPRLHMRLDGLGDGRSGERMDGRGGESGEEEEDAEGEEGRLHLSGQKANSTCGWECSPVK